MDIFRIIPALGAVLGFGGYFLDWSYLFYAGVLFALINTTLDVLSGATKFPFIEIGFVLAGAIFVSPWLVGAGLGLCAISGIEAITMKSGRL